LEWNSLVFPRLVDHCACREPIRSPPLHGALSIYIVEPEGVMEDDPNVTDKKFPGNPTRSFRTREPVRIVGEITDWVGHSPEQLQAMRDGLADLERRGLAVIYD
ncbi:NAD(+)--rifampin ADP-ribosyltransferase, partial [Rhodococcus jostii]|uniref:NAD(+)--rifampin ADP-ribosyltransferase n=1 Tax=Rhodococcus jostii TaxID=132919 RepID=UPI003650B5BF